LLHGLQIKYAENGNKQLAISYYEGKKDGPWTYYFDNQKIARAEEWKKGIKNGAFKTFSDLDKLVSEQYYKKGEPYGIHKEYYQDGREKHVRIFSKKGLLEEEYAFDDFGVKEIIKERETREMKKKKKKAKGKDNSLMN
jgi:antitoxin component YwqK of YwqJK toxin-antitoxin module